MADFNTDQRARVRWKLRTARGFSQEALMRENRKLMVEMVRLQRGIRIDVQMILASAAAARDQENKHG